MLNSKEIATDYILVLLSIVEVNGNFIGVNIGQHALKKDALPHIWFVSTAVSIKKNHIATAKVREEIFCLGGNFQCNGVVTIKDTAPFFAFYLQLCIDITRIFLASKRHIP